MKKKKKERRMEKEKMEMGEMIKRPKAMLVKGKDEGLKRGYKLMCPVILIILKVQDKTQGKMRRERNKGRGEEIE